MHKKKIAELKEIYKIEERLYTYPECVKMMSGIMRETEAKYNVRYSLCLATALSAPPYNFNSETVCEIVRLFFAQIEGLQLGVIDEVDIRDEAEKLGIIVIDDGKNLTVDINPILNKIKGDKIMEPMGYFDGATDYISLADVMSNKTEHEANFIKSKCAEMVDQFKDKNEAYADSFGKQISKYGPISALVRMSDKFNRIESLLMGTENKVADERIEDTLMDMACYCMMTMYELGIRKVNELDKHVEK